LTGIGGDGSKWPWGQEEGRNSVRKNLGAGLDMGPGESSQTLKIDSGHRTTKLSAVQRNKFICRATVCPRTKKVEGRGTEVSLEETGGRIKTNRERLEEKKN